MAFRDSRNLVISKMAYLMTFDYPFGRSTPLILTLPLSWPKYRREPPKFQEAKQGQLGALMLKIVWWGTFLNTLSLHGRSFHSRHKSVSSTQMDEKRSKGLCFHCSEKQNLDHVCKKPKLYLIQWAEEDMDLNSQEPTLIQFGEEAKDS